MLIAGLDLAAEAKGSALAVLDWSNNRATLVSLSQGVDDMQIINVVPTVSKLGIDCALGWPVEFSEFIRAHSDPNATGSVFDGTIDWRRRLAYRETDREVRRITGRWPLSVSTDRLSMTALRCAGLLSKLIDLGHDIDRTGSGLVVEVYPAASMRLWGFQFAGYRNSTEIRKALVTELLDVATRLDIASFADLMVESCDAFDALIAALATLSVVTGNSTKPPIELLSQAKIEGWIHLPTSNLKRFDTSYD